MKKNILIINTGGTISSVKSNNGYTPKEGFVINILKESNALLHDEMPNYQLLEFSPLLDSSNIKLEDWNQIANIIKQHYIDMDGFVILHGTDTMAYTASALSFVLENLNKPVIITGAQIPLSELRTDGVDNIITALYLAQNENLHEVCIYFDQRLLRGNRSQKVSAYEFSAFDSPNFPALASVGTKISWQSSLLLNSSFKQFNVKPLEQHYIANFRLFPSFSTEVLKHILKQPLKGLILETYGSGNAQDNDLEFINLLNTACANGMIIINCSQCHHGMVNMNTYATGQALRKAGVISGYNMTAEAAHCKLLYLLGKHTSLDTIRTQIEISIRGELDH